MSLGGYKFAGRFCQKGSLTDAQWALKMHKTKVAAFMAANTLSGAGWDYDMTSGVTEILITGSSANYVSYFKHTQSGTYFALYTLQSYSASGTTGLNNSNVPYVWGEVSSNTILGTQLGVGNSSFFRISKNSFNTLGAGVRSDVSGFYPTGNCGLYSNTQSSSFSGPIYSYLGDSKAYFGFAVRGASVIMFGFSGSVLSVDMVCVSIISGDAYTTLFNSNDTNNLIGFNLQGSPTSQYAANECAQKDASLDRYVVITPKYNGEFGDISFHRTIVYAGNFSAFSGAVSEYPLQSVVIGNVENPITGCKAKGCIDVSLLALNFPHTDAQRASLFSPFANGKYLCVRNFSAISGYMAGDNWRVTTTLNSDIGKNAKSLYVGWDPSNPDITQASAWTEYTE